MITNLLKTSKRRRVTRGRRLGLGPIGAIIYAIILSRAACVVHGTPVTQAETHNEGLILSHAAVGLPLPPAAMRTNSSNGQVSVSHEGLNFSSRNMSKLSSDFINNLNVQMTEVMKTPCSWQISSNERSTARGFMGSGVNKLLNNRGKFCSAETAVALAPLRTVGEEIQKTFVALQTAQVLEAQKAQLKLLERSRNAALNNAKKTQLALLNAEKNAATSRAEINALKARANREEKRANKLQELFTSATNVGTNTLKGVGGVVRETGKAAQGVVGIVTAGSQSIQNSTAALAIIGVTIATLVAVGFAAGPIGWGLRALRKFKREAAKNNGKYAEEVAKEVARVIEERINSGELKRAVQIRQIGTGTNARQTANTGTSPRARQTANTGTSPRARQTANTGTSPRARQTQRNRSNNNGESMRRLFRTS